MTIDSLHLRSERAWCALQEIGGTRTLYLAPNQGLRWLKRHERGEPGWREVGTYRKSVALDQLIGDVFATYEESRRHHGHG